MPGILGIIGCGNHDLKVKKIQDMIKPMLHEPYYSYGTYFNNNLGVYIGWVSHNDSFDSCNPIWNETNDICIIFSGENFIDQFEIDLLRKKGHFFEPDNASYLVHLYEELDGEFIKKLNGRFSGIIIDTRQAKFILFNDRYGLGRIYKYDAASCFYFASEAKALLNVLPELRQLNFRSLGEFFSCGCTLQNRTLFSEISLLPPGSAWTFSSSKETLKEIYFSKEVWENQNLLDPAEFYKKMKEIWCRILPRYFAGKNQVAVSLTGGKDSRMIMAWHHNDRVAVPCYTFNGMYRDCVDAKLASEIANICRQNHQNIQVNRDFLSQFSVLANKTVYITDGSMDVSGAVDLFVNKIARNIAPIRLTGNYGQEVLRGSIAFKPFNLNKNLFDYDFSRQVQEATQTYLNELGENKRSFVVFKQFPWHHYSRLAIELSQVMVRSPYMDNDLVSLAFQTPTQLNTSIQPQMRLISDGNRQIGKIGTDRGMLYMSIPFFTKLQHLYQEFTFKAEYAYDHGMPQWLAQLDYLLRPFHLERLFLGHHKFSHYRIWYRDDLSKYLKEVLLDTKSLSRSYLNNNVIERIVCDHINGKGNYTQELHRLLSAELIQKTLIEF